MRRVFKYYLEVNCDKQNFSLPLQRWLHVGLDGEGRACIWAEVNDSLPRPFTLHILGTGDIVPENVVLYLGSFTQGKNVWHIYQEY